MPENIHQVDTHPQCRKYTYHKVLYKQSIFSSKIMNRYTVSTMYLTKGSNYICFINNKLDTKISTEAALVG